MAKALIREHDLRVMHMGPDSDRHVRRLKVRLLEIMSVFFPTLLFSYREKSRVPPKERRY